MLTRNLALPLLLLLLGLLAACEFSHAIPKLNLATKTFKLNWHYQTEQLDAATNEMKLRRVDVEEFHSGKQRRSILHYLRDPENKSRRTYYSSDQQVIMIEGDTSRCHLIEHMSDTNRFFPGIPQALFDEGQKFMIGASKLLTLVEKYGSNFKQISSAGVEFVVFEGLFQTPSGEFILYLYYDKNLQRSTIPRMIQLKPNSRNSQILSYNMDRFQLLDDVFQMTTSAAANLDQYGDYDQDNVVFDLFAFDRAIGCNKIVDSLSETASRRLGEHDVARFSFETEFKQASQEATDENDMQRASVVYEPALASLRVHQVGRLKESLSIEHFSRNVRYHSMRNRQVGDEPNRGGFSRQGSSSCVVTTIKNEHSIQNSPFSLGRTLLGTDKLHYVGMARVRGIEALAYQWHGSDWPVWLQSPMVYEKQTDLKARARLGSDDSEPPKLNWRDEKDALGKIGLSMTGVFYFSKTNLPEEEIFDAKLLLIELLIASNDQNSARPSTRLAFPIYDFTWAMPNGGPDGSRYEDTMSLHSDCLDYSESRVSGTSQMSFDVPAADKNDLIWLQDRAKRNVAILQLMQTRFWFTPISIIQHIDSKLVSESETSLSISTVIRAAYRSQELTRAIYHCDFRPSAENFEAFKTINFEACLMTVAHKRPNSLFAYAGQLCFMLSARLAALDSFDKIIDYACSRPGQAELYQLKRQQEKLNHFNPIEDAALQQNKTTEILIRDPAAKSPPVKVKQTFVETQFSNNKVEYRSDNRSIDVAHDSFFGIGLDSSDSQNMLIESNDQIMSFEACKTACIGLFSCRSFSVCTINGQMRCTLSTVSFNGPSIVAQLQEVLKKRSKLSGKFTIKVEPMNKESATQGDETSTMDSIRVVKHPNCELHNKFYHDYFLDRSTKIKYVTGRALFRPVPSLDKCAQLCLERTIKFLGEISQLEANSDKLVANRHELMKLGICTAINYISRQFFEKDLEDSDKKHLTPTDLKQILNELTKMKLSEEVNGFCVLDNYNEDHHLEEGETHVNHEALKKLWFTRYNFDYVKFFEKSSGISLVESELGPQEAWELRQRIKDAIMKGEPVELPKENLGWTESEKESPSMCALDCFASALRNPVGCRSFDYFEVDSPNELTKKFCAFNTVTLKSRIGANKVNMISHKASEQDRVNVRPSDKVRVWHFDPRPGLFSESLSKLYTISSAREHSPTSYAVKEVGTRFGAPTLVAAAVILLVLGTTMGLVLGAKFISIKRREEVDELVEDGPDDAGGIHLQFANIVEK